MSGIRFNNSFVAAGSGSEKDKKMEAAADGAAMDLMASSGMDYLGARFSLIAAMAAPLSTSAPRAFTKFLRLWADFHEATQKHGIKDERTQRAMRRYVAASERMMVVTVERIQKRLDANDTGGAS